MGKSQRENDNKYFQNQGDLQNVALEGLQKLTLLSIIFHHIDASCGRSVVHNRDCHLRLHESVPILPGKYIVALHGGNDFREQTVTSQKGIGAVINGLSECIYNNDTVGFDHIGKFAVVGDVECVDDIGNGRGVDHIQLGNFIRGQLTFFQHSGFFVLVEQFAAGIGAVYIQKEQHKERDEHIGHRVKKLCTSVPAETRSFTF